MMTSVISLLGCLGSLTNLVEDFVDLTNLKIDFSSFCWALFLLVALRLQRELFWAKSLIHIKFSVWTLLIVFPNAYWVSIRATQLFNSALLNTLKDLCIRLIDSIAQLSELQLFQLQCDFLLWSERLRINALDMFLSFDKLDSRQSQTFCGIKLSQIMLTFSMAIVWSEDLGWVKAIIFPVIDCCNILNVWLSN